MMGKRKGPCNATSRRSFGASGMAGLRSKKAQREGRSIVFIDESGLSKRPSVARTWSLRGRHADSSAQLHIEATLGHCCTVLQTVLLSLLCRGHSHRADHRISRGTQAPHGKTTAHRPGWRGNSSQPQTQRMAGGTERTYRACTSACLRPETQSGGSDLGFNTIGEVGPFARNRLKSMQRRPALINAFWKQAELNF